MTAQTRSALNTQADTNLADNTAGDITPADVRSQVKDLADSAAIQGDTLTKGFSQPAIDVGTKSSGTFTPDPLIANIQKYINGGAHTLAPPASDCTILIQVTNNASAGAITTSGFTKVDGDAIATTNGNDYFFVLMRVGTFSSLTVKALQ